jgi:hypothetical protein
VFHIPVPPESQTITNRLSYGSCVAADAMAKCKAGNTAAGIPVLEKFLKEGKVTLRRAPDLLT